MSIGGCGWRGAITSCFEGLKVGALINSSLEREKTYRQGRHHFETVMNQVTMFQLSIEQANTFLNAVNIKPLSDRWFCGAVAVSGGAAFIASSQIRVWRLAEIANFIQDHSAKLSLLILTTASIGLVMIGQTTLVATSLAYLSLGVVERSNSLPLSVQNFVRQGQFFIAVSTGIYLGGNFIRAICVLDLVTKIARYFGFKPSSEKNNETELQEQAVKIEVEVNQEEKDEEGIVKGVTISYQDLLNFIDGKCSLSKSHIHRKFFPDVDPSVRIGDILDLVDQIDWSKHESVIKKKLAIDKRWLEVEQVRWEPLPYFKDSLKKMVESIEKKDVLTGNPRDYEMLEFYCRFITQELKKKDEITRADILICLGLDAGVYCGAGIFGVIEEIYGNLFLEGSALPLETRILASLQQERVRVWQSIYLYLFSNNPWSRFIGYVVEVNAIHTANMYKNMFQVGKKFGIPHQAAENDEISIPSPFFNYILSANDATIQALFWEITAGPTFHYEFGVADKRDWWKVWKWVHLEKKVVSLQPYNEKRIIKHLQTTIGTPLIPKWEIYGWWRDWVERQDVTKGKKEELIDELGKTSDSNGCVRFTGDRFEWKGKIQSKFLRLMLIEMGVLEKPNSV